MLQKQFKVSECEVNLHLRKMYY